MSVGFNMEDSDDLPPMGAALAQIKSDLIYREAKRQYETLMCMRDSHKETSHSELSSLPPAYGGPEKVHTTRAQHRIDLHQYYRNLFEDATSILDDGERHRLLTISFAYKTRADVLRFLGLVDEGVYPWVPLLKGIVTERSRDTVFEETVNSGPGLEEGESAITDLPGSYRLRSRTAVARPVPINIEGPYFVITTLPLAFPEKFFAALASHAPIDVLETPHILSHPSAMQLAHSDTLASLLRARLPHYWKVENSPGVLERYSVACQPAEERASWVMFFEHLLETQVTLTLANGENFFVEEGEVGYGEEDLGMWLAGWRAERQSIGMREKGAEVMLKKRLGLGGREGGNEIQVEVLNEERMKEEKEEKEEVMMLGIVAKERKRVSWHEDELTRVKEIPARPQRRRKNKGKNW